MYNTSDAPPRSEGSGGGTRRFKYKPGALQQLAQKLRQKRLHRMSAILDDLIQFKTPTG